MRTRFAYVVLAALLFRRFLLSLGSLSQPPTLLTRTGVVPHCHQWNTRAAAPGAALGRLQRLFVQVPGHVRGEAVVCDRAPAARLSEKGRAPEVAGTPDQGGKAGAGRTIAEALDPLQIMQCA